MSRFAESIYGLIQNRLESGVPELRSLMMPNAVHATQGVKKYVIGNGKH